MFSWRYQINPQLKNEIGVGNVDISKNTTKWDCNESIPKHNTALLGHQPETGKEVSSGNWTFKIIMRERDSVNTFLLIKMIISVFLKKTPTHIHRPKLYTYLLMWKSRLCKILCNTYHDNLQKCCTWGYMVLQREINLAKITFIKLKGKRLIHQLKLLEFM